ncbi:hypothetical protein ACWEKT_35860 [Nocardia takedensis]
MATQHAPVRAVPPAPPVTHGLAPGPAVSTADRPARGVTLLDTDVPVIEPYTVAALTGGGNVSATVDSVRATAHPATTGAGVLGTVTRAAANAPVAATASGKAAAKIVVRNAPVVVTAALTGAGLGTDTVDPHVPAAASTTAATTVDLGVVATAEAVFTSEGRFSALKPLDVAAVADGALTAATAAVGPVVRAADFAAGGAVGAASGQNAAVTGAGILSAAQGAPASPSGAGTLTAEQSAYGTAVGAATGSGQLSVNAVASFQPSSMTKSTAWSGMTNAYQVVPGWTADTTNYPGSSSSAEGLVVQSPKASATLAASIVFSAQSFFNATVTLQLSVNNVVVATGAVCTVNMNSSATATVTTTRSVAAGEVVRVLAAGGNASSSINAVALINAASYVRIT